VPNPIDRIRAKHPVRRLGRVALRRYAAAAPGARRQEEADRRVVIVLASAWGMGGTIRAALNLAGHLAERNDVEIISAYRRRDEPFMGAFPAGVTVTALDDQRPGAQSGLRARVAANLRRRPSVLVHSQDPAYEAFSVWTDIQLVRRLRGGAGILIGTRPGVNLALARLPLHGYTTVGEEQMNLASHPRTLRAAIKAGYGRLDALAVLTHGDEAAYRQLLGDATPRTVVIPNTVRELHGPKADLDRKLVLAAGRATPQKGFDLLIRAWAQVAPRHPDWRLRICGRGQSRPQMRALIAELGIEAEQIRLTRGAKNLQGRMQRASIYALSSRFEGFPLVLLEAMGMGMGVVAFDCPTGPGEVIDDHRNGLLVPARDVDAFAAALDTMIADEALRRSCAAAAAETARGYTMAAVGPRWDAFLAELRAARRAG
jgi:glycosyltransferase involved in cell wall biosynthesis